MLAEYSHGAPLAQYYPSILSVRGTEEALGNLGAALRMKEFSSITCGDLRYICTDQS